ncbi:MAG: PilN domain-containing protein [Planctomycetes bacterium]|nr:PilN domain-containing protein [Planctomycetota bacterium]
MTTINFVPNDYMEQRQSSRANLLYLMLLTAMLGAIGVTFGFIKMRQHSVQAELAELNTRMSKAHEQIAQLEELKTKSKTMMKTMVMTAELLEPIPRSIILASLTNDLPSGVSLIELDLDTKEVKTYKPAGKSAKTGSQYAGKSAAQTTETEIKTETGLNLKGIAPSDIQVASYIARLSQSILLDNVELVESKELEIEGIKFREFRLKALIKPNLTLSKDAINKIREKSSETI